MRIELKSSVTLSGLPITVVSLDLDTGVVEYTVDGVGLKDINRTIQETYLSHLRFEKTGKYWSLRRVVDKDEGNRKA